MLAVIIRSRRVGRVVLCLTLVILATPRSGDGQVPPASSIPVLPEVEIVSKRPEPEPARAALPSGLTRLPLPVGPIAWSETVASAPEAFILRQGPSGTRARIVARGLTGRYIRVEIDGVPINNPAGLVGRETDFDSGFPGLADRVEWRVGPQATRYGAEALAGNLRIVSQPIPRKAMTTIATTVASRGELAGSWLIGTGFTTPKGRGGGIQLAVSGVRTDGFSAARKQFPGSPDGTAKERDGSRQLSLQGSVAFFPRQGTEFRLDVRRNQLTADFDAYNFSTRRPYDGIGQKKRQREMVVFRASDDWGPIRNRLTLSGLAIDSQYIDDDAFACNPATLRCISGRGERLRAAWQLEWQPAHQRVQLTGLAELERERYRRLDMAGRETLDRRRRTIGLTLDGRVRLGKLGWLEGGLRWDDDDASVSRATGRIGVEAGPDSTPCRLIASAASGFVPPTLYQRFRYNATRDVRPEHGLLWEGGLECRQAGGWDIDKAEQSGSLRMVYYQNDITDQIGTTGSRAQRRHANLGRLRTQGVGATARTPNIRTGFGDVHGSVGYDWTMGDSQPRGTATPPVDLRRVPSHHVRTGLRWQAANGTVGVGIDFDYRSDHWDFSETTGNRSDIRIGRGERVDLHGFWQVTDRLRARLQAINLTDNDREDAAGYNTQPLTISGTLTLSLALP